MPSPCAAAAHVAYVDPVASRPLTPNHVPYVKHTAHEPYHDPSGFEWT